MNGLVVLLSTALAAPVPAPDGDRSIPGLDAPVSVATDVHGVPHITADDLDDAAAATGFLHARDRGFQLELLRLASQGRLTELFGRRTLNVDRRLRLITWNLDQQLELLPEADRRRVEAYAAGVTAGYAASPLPPEMKLLGYEPAAWTDRDVLAVALFQAWSLTFDASHEAARDRLRQAVDDDEVFAMLTAPSRAHGGSIMDVDPAAFPDLSGAAPPPEPSKDAATPAPELALSPTPRRDRLAKAWSPQPGSGSNSWAIHGSRTKSGKPILAGDPHLSLSWPAVFYEIHIQTADGVEVSGATFPGLPMVVIGRAAGIAWTLTTSYTDVEDLVTLDIADDSHYRVAGSPQPFRVVVQEFRHKGRIIHAEGYRATRWGPVFTPGREGTLRDDVEYAYNWAGHQAMPIPMTSAFEALYRATEPDQAIAAISQLPTPCQNWTFATATGHIGWVLGGHFVNPEPSPLPRDGTQADPFANRRGVEIPRPSVVDPDEGWVVATNQPPTEPPHATGTYFSGPYRALRAQQVLASRDGWTVPENRALQMDTTNLEAVRLAPMLVAAAGTPDDAVEAAMVAAVQGWDKRMQADQAAPLAYEAWRGALHRRLAAIHLDDAALQRMFVVKRFSEAAMEVALFEDGGARFWDDPDTEATETAEDAMRGALTDAAGELSGKYGSDVSRWAWGEAHQLIRDHPLAGIPLIGRQYRREKLPTDGGRHVLWALDHYGVIGDYKSEDGPALRQVVIPGERAGFVLPGGNVGRPGTRFSDDQLDDWLAGRQHVAGVAPEAPVETLRLVPQQQ